MAWERKSLDDAYIILDGFFDFSAGLAQTRIEERSEILGALSHFSGHCEPQMMGERKKMEIMKKHAEEKEPNRGGRTTNKQTHKCHNFDLPDR